MSYAVEIDNGQEIKRLGIAKREQVDCSTGGFGPSEQGLGSQD
jgi:hypothetical protein